MQQSIFDLNEENNIEIENTIPPANCKYYTIDEFHKHLTLINSFQYYT